MIDLSRVFLKKDKMSSNFEHHAERLEIFSTPQDGVVEKTITQNRPGRVLFANSFWPAKLYHYEGQPVILMTLLPNEPVSVVGRLGTTIFVVPLEHRSYL